MYFECVFQNRSAYERVRHREEQLDSFVEILGHHVWTSYQDYLVSIVSETIDSSVSRNRPAIDITLMFRLPACGLTVSEIIILILLTVISRKRIINIATLLAQRWLLSKSSYFLSCGLQSLIFRKGSVFLSQFKLSS